MFANFAYTSFWTSDYWYQATRTNTEIWC
jgi:hypothetical protein